MQQNYYQPPRRNNNTMIFIIIGAVFVIFMFVLILVFVNRNSRYNEPARVISEPVEYNYGKLKQAYHRGMAALKRGSYRTAVAYFDVPIGAAGHRLAVQKSSYVRKAEALCRMGHYTRMRNVRSAYRGIYKRSMRAGKGDWCLASAHKPRRVKRPKVFKSKDFDAEYERLRSFDDNSPIIPY